MLFTTNQIEAITSVAMCEGERFVVREWVISIV